MLLGLSAWFRKLSATSPQTLPVGFFTHPFASPGSGKFLIGLVGHSRSTFCFLAVFNPFSVCTAHVRYGSTGWPQFPLSTSWSCRVLPAAHTSAARSSPPTCRGLLRCCRAGCGLCRYRTVRGQRSGLYLRRIFGALARCGSCVHPSVYLDYALILLA